jgi:hypothetical protein
VSELHDFLKGKLPEYMMPSSYVFLQSLPLTNGKLDRSLLPLPDSKRPELGHAYVPPNSKVEESLVQVWEEILDVRPVGIHDNFFDLGGHSLSASRVIARAIETFQVDLPVSAVFDSPTVAEMARIITANQSTRTSDAQLEPILSELEGMTEEDALRYLDKINWTK